MEFLFVAFLCILTGFVVAEAVRVTKWLR